MAFSTSQANSKPLRVVLLPPQDGPGALRGKSAGELTHTTAPPATANVVATAGARGTALPITAEPVRAELARRA
jgi:hypothetical protein